MVDRVSLLAFVLESGGEVITQDVVDRFGIARHHAVRILLRSKKIKRLRSRVERLGKVGRPHHVFSITNKGIDFLRWVADTDAKDLYISPYARLYERQDADEGVDGDER